MRTRDFLYIRNFAPERWPVGAPQELDEHGNPGHMHGGYFDVDRSPTLEFLVQNREHPRFSNYFRLALGKRPSEELYDIRKDPGCLENLAGRAKLEDVRRELAATLHAELTRTGDPRVGIRPDVWETYPRYSPMRRFPAEL